MALSKKRVQDKVEIVGEYKQIQVRFIDQIIEDKKVISEIFHRDVATCGDYDKADSLGVKKIADASWTAALVKSYKAAQKASKVI